MLEVSITNEQKVKITAKPKTKAGRPASFDGAVKATVQTGDSTVMDDPDGDPNSFIAVSSDAPGDTVILVEADADLGEGVTTIQDTVTLHVTGSNADNFGLAQGEVTDK